jgi:hypothetical protein
VNWAAASRICSTVSNGASAKPGRFAVLIDVEHVAQDEGVFANGRLVGHEAVLVSQIGEEEGIREVACARRFGLDRNARNGSTCPSTASCVTVEPGAQHLVVVGGAGQQVGADLGQALFEAGAGFAQFDQGAVDVLALLLQRVGALAELLQRPGHLGRAVVVLVVEVQQFADFRQRQAHALAAQDQLQADAVLVGIDAVEAFAGRRQQALVLVEAQRAGRGFELVAQLADCKGALWASQVGQHSNPPWAGPTSADGPVGYRRSPYARDIPTSTLT